MLNLVDWKKRCVWVNRKWTNLQIDEDSDVKVFIPRDSDSGRRFEALHTKISVSYQ